MSNNQDIHAEYLFEYFASIQDYHELNNAILAVGLVADVDEYRFEFGELEFIVFVADCTFAEVLQYFGVGQLFFALRVICAQHHQRALFVHREVRYLVAALQRDF